MRHLRGISSESTIFFKKAAPAEMLQQAAGHLHGDGSGAAILLKKAVSTDR